MSNDIHSWLMNVIRRITSKKSENSEGMHSEQQRRRADAQTGPFLGDRIRSNL